MSPIYLASPSQLDVGSVLRKIAQLLRVRCLGVNATPANDAGPSGEAPAAVDSAA